jgi:hypothetical protein
MTIVAIVFPPRTGCNSGRGQPDYGRLGSALLLMMTTVVVNNNIG